MADNIGGAMFLDPEVEAIVLAFFCLVSIMIVAVLVWLVFVCLKVDRSVSWTWSVVFIPLWIVNAMALWITFYRLRHYDPKKNEEINRTFDQEEATEVDGLLGGGGKRKQQHRINQFIPFINCCLIVLFQVGVVLRLDNTIHWSSAIIFIPFYAYELLNSVVIGKKGWITRLVWVIQVTCILLQLIYIKEEYSWAFVFIPLYCLGIFFGYKLWKQYRFFSSLPTRQEAQQGKLLITITSIIYSVIAALFYTVLGFIVARLDGSSQVRLSLILIPIFILLVNKKFYCI